MKKKGKKARACAFGAKITPDSISDMIQGTAGLFDSLSGKSTATTSGQAVGQSIGNIFSGASSGMQIGQMFGPQGAAIGAAAGAAMGLIGKSGGITETGGFTEDNQYSLGTGLIGAFGNKRLKRKIEQDKAKVQANRIAVSNTANLQADWYNDNNYDTYTFADGGTAGSLAYVDDGELIQTPDGNVSKVPEQGKPTDSNLVNLPYGTKILSDTLKVPGTKKTFAQMGEEMMSKKKSKGKDRYAQNAAKLNAMNNAMIHDELFNQQEALKQKKGIKPKTKAFEDGGLYRRYNRSVNDTMRDIIIGSQLGQDKVLTGFYDSKGMGRMPNLTDNIALPEVTVTAAAPTGDTGKGTGKGRRFSFPKLGDLGEYASSIASLAPVISNLTSGSAEQVRDVQNPYAGTVARIMRNRRYDITPALRELSTSRAISDYNASQSNTNTGANMAYRLQSAVGLDKAIANLYSQASNMQNQFDADYASTLNNLGQQYVGAVNLSSDLGARNRAAAYNIRNAGLGQLSKWAQTQQLMRNQKRRDKQMLSLYKPFLESGFTNTDLTNFLRYE